MNMCRYHATYICMRAETGKVLCEELYSHHHFEPTYVLPVETLKREYLSAISLNQSTCIHVSCVHTSSMYSDICIFVNANICRLRRHSIFHIFIFFKKQIH